MSVECQIPCDYCGARPAFWFGDTSVAVCTKAECRRRCNESWDEHCAIIDAEYKAEREMYGDPMAPIGDDDDYE